MPFSTIPLFVSESGERPFDEIHDEMVSVRDLLQAMHSAPTSKVNELKAERAALVQSGERFVFEGTDITDDVVSNYDAFRIPYALDRLAALREGASSLLLFAFLEHSLRAICAALEENQQVIESFVAKDQKREKGRSKIDGYLAFLEDRGLEFGLPGGFSRVRSREKQLRNYFTHGEWDLHYFVANDGDARQTFRTITQLLGTIERAFIRRTAA